MMISEELPALATHPTPVVASPQVHSRLVAHWEKIDGKLICKWLLEDNTHQETSRFFKEIS